MPRKGRAARPAASARVRCGRTAAGHGWRRVRKWPGGKSDRLLGPWRTERLAFTAYRTGGVLTGSAARLGLANMQDRLMLRARPTMLLILSAEEKPGKPAAQTLAAFRQSTGSIEGWMDRIAALR